VEVVTYRSGDECVEKTRYLLAHDSERRAIAAAGHRRTLRDHTYFQRIKTMAGILDRLLGDD
jgi:spore maturation protein CgeB